MNNFTGVSRYFTFNFHKRELVWSVNRNILKLADVGVDTFNMHLPVVSSAKTHTTVLALKRSYFVMYSPDVPGKIKVLSKQCATFEALVSSLLLMNNLDMLSHFELTCKPLPTLWTLVIYSLMNSFLMLEQASNRSIPLGTAFYNTLEGFVLGVRGGVW